MPDESSLFVSIDRALAVVRGFRSARLVRQDGLPATDDLRQLAAELQHLRVVVRAGGRIDPAWMAELIRGAAAWLPESDIAILAALGAIARAGRVAGQQSS